MNDKLDETNEGERADEFQESGQSISEQENPPTANEQEKHTATSAEVWLKVVGWTGGITVLLIFFSLGRDKEDSKAPPWAWQIVLGLAAVAVAAGFITTIMAIRRRERERQQEIKRLDTAADLLRERVELPSLINFNRVLLEQYHEIATRQANKSFRAALTAMSIGLGVIVATFVASFARDSSADRFFLGSLAAVSAALTGYLSKTYLDVYDRSIRQLNQYFNQPVLNNYFLTAERVTGKLSDEHKEKLLMRIATDILTTGTRMHEIFDIEDEGKRGFLGRAKRGRRQAKEAHEQGSGAS
ncbi:TRADD-N-associated membrane domain-containing protein [Streptomyces sp. SAJ15]|uniref:TRADD-N-associated membrane domain-containing protein n=1 Tax=Streptomyces sp. SAJ15 TaxID=2011095 RepID=UPI00118648EB|nr:hypothetical protein [Streptomyces sp. SAJ15]